MGYSLVNMWELSNHKLFDDIQLPMNIDKETLINTIFDTCDELEPITPTLPLLKMKIEVFFKRNYNNFERLVNAYNIEYEPIENYDKKLENTTKYDGVRNNTGTTSNSSTMTSSDNLDMTETNKVSAFDSSDFSNNSQTSTDSNNSKSENNTFNDNTSFRDVNDDTTTITERVHGNIGVTTSQQMLSSEVKLWRGFNVYEVISEKFMFELMITCV